MNNTLAFDPPAQDTPSVNKEHFNRPVRSLVPNRGYKVNAAGAESLRKVLAGSLLVQTPSLLPLVEGIALAATHDFTLLLNGETGTGKTFLARLIHECSSRQQHRLLVVSCGAVAANLIESEFFGHVQGAFTGANGLKVGKFAAVGRGTLLLDEIDTLDLEQQATLLRVIETSEFEPVGSNETQKSQARLIVATNVDLEDAIRCGRFRADLYYRLNMMSLHLPPLRARVLDIAPLVSSMVSQFNCKFKKNLNNVSAEAIAALEAFPWPGNIRQLENVIQHAVLICDGPELLLKHLPQMLCRNAVIPHTLGNDTDHELAALPLKHQRDLVERDVIQRALTNNSYRLASTAIFLGISRVTLYKKLKKYGLNSRPLRKSSIGKDGNGLRVSAGRPLPR